MRIWNQQLINKLCTKHLLATWREGIGCANIITENKDGYKNHPATREFINNPQSLLARLFKVHQESQRRGYKFDASKLERLYQYIVYEGHTESESNEWQTLDQQIEIIKKKGCACLI